MRIQAIRNAHRNTMQGPCDLHVFARQALWDALLRSMQAPCDLHWCVM